MFLDVNASGELSPEEFKRGLWRLNLHEIWRCPMGPSCCRYDCAYQVPSGDQKRAPNLHSYLVVSDDMARELLLRMDTQGGGTSAQISIDIKEFMCFFDTTLVHDAHIRNRLHSAAIKDQQKVIQEGREWGTLEDWRRHARAKGWSAKRDLYTSMKQVDADRQLRAAAFETLRQMQDKVSAFCCCLMSLRSLCLRQCLLAAYFRLRQCFLVACLREQGEAYVRAHQDEREQVLARLTEAMSIYRHAQETAYEAIHDGCAFMVLRAPLLDYFGISVPPLNRDCENVHEVVEKTLEALESLNDEQRYEVCGGVPNACGVYVCTRASGYSASRPCTHPKDKTLASCRLPWIGCGNVHLVN